MIAHRTKRRFAPSTRASNSPSRALPGFPVARVRNGTRLGSSSTATKVGAGSFVKVAQRLEAKMMLPFYLVLVTVLFPPPAAGQSRSFTVESDVTVRADSFACKETSELDHLLQRNQSGGFTSGTQLYNYLKAHKCLGLTAGRARVYSTRGQCLHLRSERQQDQHLSLRLDANRDAVEMKRRAHYIETSRARVKTKTCSRGLRVLHATPRPMVGKNDFNRNLRKKSRRSSHAGRAVRLPR